MPGLLLVTRTSSNTLVRRTPSVADPDPGSGLGFFPDPVSQTYIFASLMTTFLVNNSIILYKLAHIFFFISFIFVIFVAAKKGRTANFFHPSLLLLFLDPGSGMDKNQVSGINIQDPQHCEHQV